MREEIFGPVVAAMRFRDEDEADRARPTTPSTGSRAPSGRSTSGAPCASRTRLRAGTVWINAYRVVGPNMPFGGFKASGIGRENGLDVLHEYTETKSVWIETSGATRDPFTLG